MADRITALAASRPFLAALFAAMIFAFFIIRMVLKQPAVVTP